MTPARKRRIWEAWSGKCWFCRMPVEQAGPTVIYDHISQLWMSGSDADEGIGPIHSSPCNKIKTAADAAKRAKVKRIIKREAGEKNPTTLRGRGFEKGRRRFGLSGRLKRRGRHLGEGDGLAGTGARGRRLPGPW